MIEGSARTLPEKILRKPLYKLRRLGRLLCSRSVFTQTDLRMSHNNIDSLIVRFEGCINNQAQES